MLQTEYEFTLPKGFIDFQGNLHRDGVMRLATAMDEITPLRDPRVRNNDAYLSIIILSRVIARTSRIEPAFRHAMTSTNAVRATRMPTKPSTPPRHPSSMPVVGETDTE